MKRAEWGSIYRTVSRGCKTRAKIPSSSVGEKKKIQKGDARGCNIKRGGTVRSVTINATRQKKDAKRGDPSSGAKGEKKKERNMTSGRESDRM